MYGAILGDMIGSPYEFDRGYKTKEFPLFIESSVFTDDSVMTIAVAEALLDASGKTDDEIREALVKSMQKWGRRYPYAGYGGRFAGWLRAKDPKPYGSYGNGSAMRVSSAGWLYDTFEETRRYARLTAEVTHNHPEGIKGAEAAASAIFLARSGAAKDEIREYIVSEFGYDLSRTCDEIRPDYHHVESCQGTVPEAITAFLEGTDFEDVIRTAVSLGGDCDTLTCIAGGMAEAFYGVPEELIEECRKRLPDDMLEVLDSFSQRTNELLSSNDAFLAGNIIIEEAIADFSREANEETLTAVLESIRERMHKDGHFIVPVITDEKDPNLFCFQAIKANDGKLWNAVFTSNEEFRKGAPSQVISNFIDICLKFCLESNQEGFIINPWGQPFMLSKELIEHIFEADEGVEYTVPDDPVTPELLEDGSFLKRAVGITNRNRTELNLIKLFRILHESFVWIPARAELSDRDYEAWTKVVKEAEAKGDLGSIEGTTLTNQDEIRLVPDILQSGDDLFFPVFTTAEEMGEYGEGFSKIEKSFIEVCGMAKNSEHQLKGIVINAFTDNAVIPIELIDVITRMK